MALKKDKKSGKKSSAAGKIFNKIKFFKRTFLVFFLIAAGGFLFNLDRMGDFGITLLKYKKFVPHYILRFLPGGTADDGTALPEQEIYGKVIEVYDGDTATVLTEDNKKFRIRFYGIDAPEAAQDSGDVSRDALREKILGGNVVVRVIAVDRYGRAVGKVMSGGRYVNLEMVAEGMAWYYRDYADREYDLAMAEKSARQHRIGLWRKNNPQPPWEWRKANKK